MLGSGSSMVSLGVYGVRGGENLESGIVEVSVGWWWLFKDVMESMEGWGSGSGWSGSYGYRFYLIDLLPRLGTEDLLIAF